LAEIQHIGYLISQYPATNHTFILREIRQLRSTGFDIRVASLRGADRPASQMTAEEQEELAQTYYIKPAGILHALRCNLQTLILHPVAYGRSFLFALRLGGFDVAKALRTLFYLIEAVVAGVWIQKQELRHVHTHFTSTVALLLSKVFPVDLSMTIHGPDEFIDPAGFHLAEKISASLFVCAISQYGRSQLMKASGYQHWSKFEVCPLGVDPAIFAPRPFNANPNPFRIISVGRLAPVKGHHILVSAVDRLIQAGRNVQVRLVGDGPERASLEEDVRRRGLSANIVFEGSLNQDRVRALYRESDCFVLPSFAEGVPVVLMEAMATEIPCVTTWITGIPELIDNGTEGLLAPPSDDEAIAGCIARLMDDPDLRQRIGKAGRAKVVQKYDLRQNVERLARIFRERMQG
jgi:colanic acid/amylovoran biosynthesis glycosyltransferase